MKNQSNDLETVTQDTQKNHEIKKENPDNLSDNLKEFPKKLTNSDLEQLSGGRAFIPKIKNNLFEQIFVDDNK